MDRHLNDICIEAATWFHTAARTLPWRSPGCTPWGILVSEVMLQQTPVSRVLPVYLSWMSRWPTPTELAAAPTADVIREWGRLGYPRRALRLRACAVTIVERYDGQVPPDVTALLSLPGIGTYTAHAVAAFAFGQRQPVIDINVARVISRAVDGVAIPPSAVSRKQLARLAEALPDSAVQACAGLMELGATVCTSRSPRCEACPLETTCAWRAKGEDAPTSTGRTQKWIGTDRQARGMIMGELRKGPTRDFVWPDAAQLEKCLQSLEYDGLAVLKNDEWSLPEE